MLSANELKNDILNDMRVELSDEFDRNFERKAFFTEKWKPRAHDYPRGSLLIVTGAMRRSTQGRVEGPRPYAKIHHAQTSVYRGRAGNPAPNPKRD